MGVRCPLAAVIPFVLFCACRGEPVPRDYQNNPPAMTHPPLTRSQTPAANGMPGPSPQPNTGVEAQNVQPVNPTPPPAKIGDNAPITTSGPAQVGSKPTPLSSHMPQRESGPPPQNSQQALKSAPVVVTGTHLAPPP